MAFTVAFDAQPDGRAVTSNKALRTGTLTFDNSYATGGEAITAALLELNQLDRLRVDPTAGYTFEFDKANLKLKAFTSVGIWTATYDPASLASGASRDDTITVTGVAATDVCVGYQSAAALTAAIVPVEARVSAVNTITVRLTNPSAGAVDAASGTWTFYTVKANGASYEVANATDLSAVVARFRAEGF